MSLRRLLERGPLGELSGTIVTLLGLYVLLGALVSFIGWAADQPRLADWDADGIAIQPNATVAAMSAGAGLLLLAWGFRRSAALFGGLVMLIASATLFEWVSGIDLGIDTLLMFDRTWGRVGVIAPGRMGPPGSVSWVLVGIALLLASRPQPSTARRWASIVSIVPTTISALALVGYLYQASALYTVPTLTIIALQTATFIFAVSIGLIVSAREHGPMRMFSQQSPAGVLTRRLLPFLFFGPIVLGFLGLAGQAAGLYDISFGSASRSVVEVALFLLILWRAGIAIDRQTEQRRRAEAERERLLILERAARADAERQAAVKDEFLATLSHELRTPLNAVLGWSHVLRNDLGDAVKARHALDIIERNGRLQAQLIADLLDMSRIVSGKMRLDVRKVELTPVIDAAIESVRPAADAKTVRIEQVIDPHVEYVNGDPGRLHQIVWNVLSNAVKFTPSGGRIQVVVARAESEVEIRISDDGEGIAAEFLPHLFDRFRQADAGAARTHGGLGLGLALVKQLVELHGGEVTAASDGPGRGATFTIALPLATLQTTDDRLPAPRTTVEPPPGEGEITDLEGVSVLVVDDEPDALEMVRRILVERRAAVVAASGTNEALPLIAQRRFDVIVSDIAMPDRDGYEFMKECRTRGVTTPAIALTAFAGARDRTMALFAGYQSHVSKPVDPTELLATIAAFMRSTPK